jgi:hypothetical protein
MRRSWTEVAVGVAVAALAASPATADSIHLICQGTGVAMSSDTTVGSAYANNGVEVQGNSTTYSRQRTAERVTVELEGNVGRIQMPNALIPPLNSGGKNGWWPLDRLVVGDAEITGRFTLNFLNKPQVRIDRRTAQISIRGFAGLGFDGDCETFDPDPAARKF